MLTDPQTHHALKLLGTIMSSESRRAWPGGEQEKVGRQQAGRVRQQVLDDLPRYLQQLESSAQANGVTVLWADGAQEANRLVIDLMRKDGVLTALRNRSPLLDEIKLDEAAEMNHIVITNMHPGDQIVRLADSAVGHPVWPAAHLNIEAVSDALRERWGVPTTYDPHILSSAIRSRLRRALLKTPTVILGLDFAVAETGSLVCLDNDGHTPSMVGLGHHVIALLSIEQVVASTEDLHCLIRAHAKSAWGRPLPTYITQLDRPLPQAIDGPRQIHLILVDNNRSKMMAAGFSEALRCTQCGACHNVCPVFWEIGSEGYAPSPYVGPIGSIINPLLLREGLADEQPYFCSTCDACAPVCPVDIDITGLLQQQRERLSPRATSKRERFAFWLWQRLLPHPRFFKLALRFAGRFANIS